MHQNHHFWGHPYRPYNLRDWVARHPHSSRSACKGFWGQSHISCTCSEWSHLGTPPSCSSCWESWLSVLWGEIVDTSEVQLLSVFVATVAITLAAGASGWILVWSSGVLCWIVWSWGVVVWFWSTIAQWRFWNSFCGCNISWALEIVACVSTPCRKLLSLWSYPILPLFVYKTIHFLFSLRITLVAVIPSSSGGQLLACQQTPLVAFQCDWSGGDTHITYICALWNFKQIQERSHFTTSS